MALSTAPVPDVRTRQPAGQSVRTRLLAPLPFYASLAGVATIVAIWALGLMSRSWGIPLFYKSDALSGGSQIKGTLENGWYEFNPALAAPQGQTLHDFPLADNLQFAIARLLGVVLDDWAVVYNTTYVLTYPLAAMTAGYFLRVVGASRISAFGLGLLFSFAPYHFMHGIAHLSLSMYFPVPLAAALLFLLMSGRPVWGRRRDGRTLDPRTWATSRTLGTMLILAVLGSTSSYYAVFTLIFLSFVVVVLLVRRVFVIAAGGVVAAVTLMGVMFVNMAPDLWYARSASTNYAAFERLDHEAELYALKFSSLILPTHWNRIGDLGAWRFGYDETFPLPGERPALGLVAALGFVFLLLLPVLAMAFRQRFASDDSEFWKSQRILAFLTFLGFFFGTVGGFATLFAILVSPSIRAWNRIAIFLMLFGLAAVALVLDRVVRGAVRPRLERVPRRWRTGVLALPCALIVAVGLFDQVAPSNWGLSGTEEQDWASDSAYVQAVEAQVPSGGMIVQLPFMPFPESQPIFDITDYDPIRPYLHSEDLRWTYGGIKGIPRSAWTERLSTEPVREMVVQASAAGAAGIHIDRFGYAAHDTTGLESQLAARLHTEPVVSPDGRFAFFDMTRVNRTVRQRYTTEQVTEIRRRTLLPPQVLWHLGFQAPAPDGDHTVLTGLSASPSLVIGNPATESRTTIAFIIRADGAAAPTPVDVTWPDGSQEQLLVPLTGLPVRKTLILPAGRSGLTLSATGIPTITLLDLAVSDPVLASLVAEPG